MSDNTNIVVQARLLERSGANNGILLGLLASEVERLHEIIRQIAVNHDAEWGRALARRHLGLPE